MISDIISAEEAYVWIWLPDQKKPVVAGKLTVDGNRYLFKYGESYRNNPLAIPLSPFELPLTDETFEPTGLRLLPSCIRDALPDAWGRRLIDYQYPKLQANECDYGLLSGSNRIGALDFQQKHTEFQYRNNENITLKDIDTLANAIELNLDITPNLEHIILHGTSVGGARPKCLMQIDDIDYIAKFSLSTDQFSYIRLEFLGMRLAKLMGISTSDVTLKKINERDVLLVKRFDRNIKHHQSYRHLLLSALSLLGLDEMEARYASYLDLADTIRKYFDEPKKQLHELFKRLSFNILIGNTDDHARNHSAFWDGKILKLTPAYDMVPQMRVGFEATQTMKIEGETGDNATFKNILSVCDHFLLTPTEARTIINHQITTLDYHWLEVCKEAKLNKSDQKRLLSTAVKSEFCLEGF